MNNIEDPKELDKANNLVASERLRHNYTVEELSEKTGIPEFVIESIEKGNRLPSIQDLHALSIVLDLSYFDLVGDLMDAD